MQAQRLSIGSCCRCCRCRQSRVASLCLSCYLFPGLCHYCLLTLTKLISMVHLFPKMIKTITIGPGAFLCTQKQTLTVNTAVQFEIVVAHFNENLEWLKHVSAEVTVYSKGDLPTKDFERTSKLPNIGREGHTFLHHIVSRYDTLATTTLFLQGDIYAWNEGTPPHTALSLAEMRERSLTLTGLSATGFGVSGRFKKWNGMEWDKDPKRWLERRGKGMRMSDLTPGHFWQFIFDAENPESVAWTGSGIFAVTSEAIRRRPLPFWQKLLGYFEELNHANPEEGHFLERFWMSIFSAEDWSAPGSSDDSSRATDSDAS
jgi:hypothetical protein